jgi:hypothetical protein
MPWYVNDVKRLRLMFVNVRKMARRHHRVPSMQRGPFGVQYLQAARERGLHGAPIGSSLRNREVLQLKQRTNSVGLTYI